MANVHGKHSWRTFMANVHGKCSWRLFMANVHHSWRMFMANIHTAFTLDRALDCLKSPIGPNTEPSSEHNANPTTMAPCVDETDLTSFARTKEKHSSKRLRAIPRFSPSMKRMSTPNVPHTTAMHHNASTTCCQFRQMTEWLWHWLAVAVPVRICPESLTSSEPPPQSRDCTISNDQLPEEP